jgi:hypothetical protein
MFIMEMKCTFKTVETSPILMLQPKLVGCGGATLYIKGEIADV